MSITIYGIKNCDTMKKAFRWLDENGVSYDFHDYKKQGIDTAILKKAIDAHGWDTVINRRGTTWRQLPDDVKNNMDAAGALNTANKNPSIIKRPLLAKDDEMHIGFQEDAYKKIFT